jgi:hypothetical protein
MSISTPAPPPKKKSGCGCLGCGCLIVIILLLLLAGLIGGMGYFGYKGLVNMTTATPAEIPAFTAPDSSYATVQQKMAEFGQATANHQPSSIQLSSDELNTLISHNPDLAKKNIRVYVTLTGDEGRLQASLPTDSLAQGVLPDRYLNFDVTFGVSFDQQAKAVNLEPKSLKVGTQTVLGESPDNSQTASTANFNKMLMNSFVPSFNQSFNQGLRKNPDIAKFLDQTQSIEIKDGELVIQTQ